MKIYKIAKYDNLIYPNEEDFKSNFLGKNYKIEIGAWSALRFIVNADCLQGALDVVIDYIAEHYPNMFLSAEETENLEEPEEYISGGNNGSTLNVTHDQMFAKEMTPQETSEIMETLKKEEPEGMKAKMMKYLLDIYGSEYSDDAEIAIYWFASHYHGGQNSELYSILSTSPYNPGHVDFENEDETVQDMYKSLEETEFTVIKQKTLDDLKSEAISSCENRGHKMGEWEDSSETDPVWSVSHCDICDKYVEVNLKPAPNQIDISGYAVALNCKPPYETATPEELYRELGLK